MVWKRVVAAVLASADKHSASVQPHSSTGVEGGGGGGGGGARLKY